MTRVLGIPFLQAALVSSYLAVFFILNGHGKTTLDSAYNVFWLAGLWLLMSWVFGWPILFSACQLAFAVGVVLNVTAGLENEAWFEAHPYPLPLRYADPRCLQAFGIGLAWLSLVWTAAQIGLGEFGRIRNLLEPVWPGVNRMIVGALVVGTAFLAVLSVAPAVQYELTAGSDNQPFRIFPFEETGFAQAQGTGLCWR